MKRLTLSDEQAMLILFALRLYAIECDKQALAMRKANNDQPSDGEMITIQVQRAQQVRELSNELAREQ